MTGNSSFGWSRVREDLTALWEERVTGGYGEGELPAVYRFIRFWIFVGKSFARNRCPIRASSLAYTTLLALVPVLAVGISIATSLLRSETKEWAATVVQKFAPQLNVKTDGSSVTPEQVIETINTSIDKIQSGALGVTGIVALAFIAISLLSSIENTMNDIWGVTRGRHWGMRIVYYWTAITLGAVMLMVVTGVNIGSYFNVETAKGWVEQWPWMARITGFAVPVALLTLAFAVFYFLMPNTRVEWNAALLGGLAAAVLFHLNSQFNVIYFGQVVRNSKIYGSLAGFPVFLIGLYFSWLIVLLGAQLSYAVQNRRTYFQEKHAESIHQAGKEFLALRIMTLLARHYRCGEKPPGVAAISEQLAVPGRIIIRILRVLMDTRLVVEVAGTAKTGPGYAPARPLAHITCQHILDALRSGIGQDTATRDDADRIFIRAELARVQEAQQTVAGAITLEKLVEIPVRQSQTA